MASLAAEGGENAKASGPPESVQLNGKSYKPLADGNYDVIVLGTGMKECVLAGLLAVSGKRVLQLDRNGYYGGDCASLDLEALHEHFNKPYDEARCKAELGRPRSFLCDLIPKFILANGKLVKMLIHTGVTKYIDFCAVDTSFVYTSGKVYKVPVTPAEAMATSLVGFFQKRNLRNFATYISEYVPQEAGPKDATATLAASGDVEAISKAVAAYYARHVPSKVGDVGAMLQQYQGSLPKMMRLVEDKYGVSMVPQEYDVAFGEGPMGLKINPRPVGDSSAQRHVTMVVNFDASVKRTGDAEKVEVGHIISKLNGEDVLWMKYDDLLTKIRGAGRPLTLTFMHPVPDRPKASAGDSADLASMTAAQIYSKYSLDANSQCFIGHAMALNTDDSYLQRSALELVEAVKTYGLSVGRYGDSPYIYPLYGLSGIPEGFARLSAVHGGVIMLRQEPDEIMFDEKTGNVCGVRCKDMAATCSVLIGDPSYFGDDRKRATGSVVRSMCLLKHPVPKTNDTGSAQIIMPAKHLKNRNKDIFISILGNGHEVAPKGVHAAIISTEVETSNPLQEVEQGIKLLGPIAARFDSVSQCFEPTSDGTKDNVYVTRSYDATSHFEYESREVMDLYERITGKPVDMSISVEEAMKKQREAMGY